MEPGDVPEPGGIRGGVEDHREEDEGGPGFGIWRSLDELAGGGNGED